MTVTRRSAAALLGAQVVAALLLLAGVALERSSRHDESIRRQVPGDHDGWVLASVGALVVLTLPVVILLALLLSAALMQIALGLMDVEIGFHRALSIMLVGTLPLAVRNVVLGGVAWVVGGEQVASLIRFGDPFVLVAMLLVATGLSWAGVGRWRAIVASLFVLGLPVGLQAAVGLGST